MAATEMPYWSCRFESLGLLVGRGGGQEPNAEPCGIGSMKLFCTHGARI